MLRREVPGLARWIAVAAAAVASVALPAGGQQPPGRVLTPRSGEIVAAGLRRLPPPWVLAGAQVRPNHVDLEVCRGKGGRCTSLALGDPASGCPGERAGPFCVRGLSEGAEPAAVTAVQASLAAAAEREVWTPPPASARAPAPMAVDWRPGTGLLAWLLVLGPIGLGLAAGALLTRAPGLRRLSRVPGAAFAGLGLAAGAVLGPALARLGVWDGASLGALWGAGLALALRAGHGPSRRVVLLGLGALVIALGLGELGARMLLPRPSALPPVEPADLRMPRFDLDRLDDNVRGEQVFHPSRGLLDHCGYLFPDHFRRLFDRFTAVRPGVESVVLHLGDSMTVGGAVGRQGTFPALLDARVPTVAHLDAAAQGTTIDFHLVVARHWIERMARPPNLVVLNLFVGNDVEGMDLEMPCCDDGPLLAYGPEGVRERCPRPSWPPGWGRSAGWFLRHSPPPFPLLAAAKVSRLAQHASLAILALRQRSAGRMADLETRWPHFEQAVRALASDLGQRGIALAVVIIPLRFALEAPDPERTIARATARRMAALAVRLGLPTFDAWDRFAGLVRAEGAARLFEAGDVHFTAAGHAAMAEWLAPRIDALLASPAP